MVPAPTPHVPSPDFAPGFRFSVLDGFVLAAGVVAAAVLAIFVGWLAFVVGFTVAHFFLFCNVFRLSRSLELVWAGVFVVLCAATILLENPGWIWTAAISLSVTALVVVIEMRKPSYHGIGWQLINPSLEAWWAAQHHEGSPVEKAAPSEIARR